MATIRPGQQRFLVAAAYDGTVLCFTKEGDLVWKNHVSDALPLDLDVCDLDGDGRDESTTTGGAVGLVIESAVTNQAGAVGA